MKKHKHSKTPLFKYGTQPILNLAFVNNVGKLSKNWNTLHLGGNKSINKDILDNAAVLHWNGVHKPWLNNGYYKNLWNPYTI
jgi:alpha-1,4-galacturonosyltransferase